MSDYLPQEVILEILRRLPVKSLVKCRSVCKAWNSLIKSPSFISSHLQTALSKPNDHLLLLRLFENDKESYFLHFDNDDFDEYKQLHFPFKSNSPWFRLVGSCNGLVCLQDGFFPLDSVELILWNPSIQKYITLPKPGVTCLSGRAYNSTLGFGFDSRTNDYKLLNVVSMSVGEEAETLTEVYLFSLDGNSWKRVTAISPKYGIEGHEFSAFVNGAVHWLGYQRGKDGGFRNMVLGFDISTEKFNVIRLPESLVDLCPMDLSIMKYEESSIAVLKRDWEDGEQLDMWVMKEYGVNESWTKVLHLTDQSGESLPRVLGFRKNREVLLEVDGGELASLDLNCRQMENLGIEAEAGFLFVGSYVESMALLDKGIDTGSLNDANHVNDSSDSDASSEGESEMT
ncbi:F-box and associated interaction domains-containing protein, putative isoform 1 [Theobroma cacao]|uniref:F-box and associated interaction domains-containing protein, putative isoform 1 n=1 Tax=Theobroma cacao TaxID=3641 RepID=A0A061F7J2_THECC|nr:F-box and associated interaction domains-containing protein, putative isoform 1 [Theobroma cacao]EOY12849.1 F-box and associated interaction domains-containing protein, putative isoform 1 [Theobroma cacao]EOY12850.1 F-box and associated interaction domains-containing protein, putative isoform 1 [Theobroma cacao]